MRLHLFRRPISTIEASLVVSLYVSYPDVCVEIQEGLTSGPAPERRPPECRTTAYQPPRLIWEKADKLFYLEMTASRHGPPLLGCGQFATKSAAVTGPPVKSTEMANLSEQTHY